MAKDKNFFGHFVGIDIHDLGSTKDFTGIDFRGCDLYKDFAGIKFGGCLKKHFGPLVYLMGSIVIDLVCLSFCPSVCLFSKEVRGQ